MTFNCNFCAKPCSLKCICGVFYCSDRCQKYDWKYHKKSCLLVSIRVIDEEKGRGLVANRSLYPSQIVLEDSPVLLIGSNIKQDHQTEVINQYNSLTELQKFELQHTVKRIRKPFKDFEHLVRQQCEHSDFHA